MLVSHLAHTSPSSSALALPTSGRCHSVGPQRVVYTDCCTVQSLLPFRQHQHCGRKRQKTRPFMFFDGDGHTRLLLVLGGFGYLGFGCFTFSIRKPKHDALQFLPFHPNPSKPISPRPLTHQKFYRTIFIPTEIVRYISP